MLRLNPRSRIGRFLFDPDIKMILVIFAPIFVDMILNNLISTVHSLLVADAGEAAISGIGLVGTINSILTIVFATLPSAVTILVSQYRGANNEDGARKCVSQSTVMVAAFASVVMAIMLLFPDWLFSVFFTNVEADVLREGKTYLLYSAISMPFYGIFQNGACTCRGYGNNKIPLYTSVSASVVNVVLAFIFIIPMGMGVMGAGLALLISRFYSAIAVSVLLWKNGWFCTISQLIHIDWKCLGAIAKLGLLSSSESLIVNFGATLKMRYVVAAGTSHIAANSIHNTFFSLVAVPISALATVAITLVGRYIGAGEKEETRKIIKKILYLTTAIYTIMMIVAIIVFPYLYPLYTDNPETKSLLVKMMFIHAGMMFIANPYVNIITNAFKGAGDAWYCTIVSVICMWTINVGLGILLTADFGLGLGVIGTLISGNASVIVKGIIYWFRFRGDKWMKKRLVD
ncbi:MAG: MATE family efflux transporter [Clostridia bacterium]|nr:MATE family efflux transporter [Clostridia bacterium]